MKLTISALVILVSLSVLSLRSAYGVDFKAAELSAEGQQAYQKLSDSKAFGIGLVGYGRNQSPGEIALRVLLREKKAVKALQSLLRSATPEGSLYALFGLRIKDSGVFKKELENYKALPELPERMIDERSNFKVSAGSVLIVKGCWLLDTNRQEVINLIETGNYDEAFSSNKRGITYVADPPYNIHSPLK